MSPEQARGHEADKRSDIWSFGVVLYELLTGRRMFDGPTVSDSLAAVLKTDPDWSALPADTPAPIRRLLRRCLERDRKRRLADIGDARLDIDEALTAPPAEVAVAAALARRSPWAAIAAAVFALAAAGIAIVHFRETPPEADPVRFEIPAPAKHTFSQLGMAVAPDGKTLAFIARDAGGTQMIWLRSLDSTMTRALPGTEGAAFLPFWSPDGRSLGFATGTRLKKIQLSGGPAQTLCDVPITITGGSWSPEGVILFGGNAGGLYRVPQAGGTPVLAVKSEEARGEIGHMRPWFLPDGRHFLYWSRARRTEVSAIHIGSLDGTPGKRLMASGQAGRMLHRAPDRDKGHVLYLRESTLMAQPADPGSYELTGDAFPVAERIGSTLALAYFSVSNNGILAFRTGASGGGRQLTWFDREGKPAGTIGAATTAFSTGLSLSPDGKRVVFDALDSSGNRDLWIADLARNVPTRFTFDPAVDYQPVWSADGAQIYFASDRGTTAMYNIYRKNADGSGEEQLILKAGDDAIRPLDSAPDGRTLIYFAVKNGLDIWALPLTPAASPAKPTPLLESPFSESHARISPDGRWMAYVSNDSGSTLYKVYVQPFPSGGGKFQVADGTQPRWRRDGKGIVYVAPDGKLMAVEVRTAPAFETGQPKTLFDAALTGSTLVNAHRYAVTADGKRFLVNSIPANAETAAEAGITVVVNWQAAVKQ